MRVRCFYVKFLSGFYGIIRFEGWFEDFVLRYICLFIVGIIRFGFLLVFYLVLI